MLLLSALPVLVVVALIAARRSALHSAALGLATALAVAWWRFPIPAEGWAALGAQWSPVLLEVLLIIAGGLALSEAGRLTSRQDAVAEHLRAALGTGPGAALAVVHGVTPFAESVTGFGIGITVAIPLLLSLGLDARRACTIGLLGLCAVPWGSMGPGTLIAAELSGLDVDRLGLASAIASGPAFLIVGLATAAMTSVSGRRGPALLAGTASGCMLWAAITGANALLGTAPAGAVGSLATLGAHLLLHRLLGASHAAEHPVRRPLGPLLDALSGHAVLLTGVLAATAVLAATGSGSSSWRYAASPALWLIAAVGATTPRRLLPEVLGTTRRRWVAAGPITALFVALGAVMAASGMSATLAESTATLGGGAVFALPIAAGIGGMLTGSNSAANAMLAAPHAQIAAVLGLPLLPVMAAHNVASSLLIMASPARIELAAQLCPDPATARGTGARLLLLDAAVVAVLAMSLALLT